MNLKGEFTDFLKFNTTLGHIYTLYFTIKTPSDRFRMAVMAQNVVLFCTLLSLHKEKTLTTNRVAGEVAENCLHCSPHQTGPSRRKDNYRD